MCADEKANVQQGAGQMREPQGYTEAPEGVPENQEEKRYTSPEAALGYGEGMQAPWPEAVYQPMYGVPQGQPHMQMPYMGQPMMGAPISPQFIPHPQMPPHPRMYQQIPQPVYGAPQGQPYWQPDMGSHGGKGGCSHHTPEDPFGGMFNMFGEMVNNNPNLSSLNKMVSATNSDFLKGALLGAGLTLLLTSDGVKDMLSGLLAGTMNLFDDENDTGEENE